MNSIKEVVNKPSRARSLRRSMSYLLGPMLFYRISHALYRIGLWPLAEIVRYFGIFFFHSDISYKAVIGKKVSLTHYGLGVVIGKYARINDECVIMPGVLIGATLRDQRMPELKTAVVVGAGAKVLGAVVIGEGAVIGANSVVASDVPPYAMVSGNPAKVQKEYISLGELDC